jgi:hypothetical protein
MDFFQSTSMFILAALSLSLVSCGRQVKPHSSSATSTLCSGIDCLSTINWKIRLHGKNFPEKTRLDINGEVILNECLEKQKYTIDRDSSPQSIWLESFYVPKQDEVQVEIHDLGPDCRTDSLFLSDDNVRVELSKESETQEILVDL